MNQITLDLQPPEPEYREITLTKGQIAIVDAADYEWLNQWKWCAQWCKNAFYAMRWVSRTGNPGKRVMKLMHGEFSVHEPNVKQKT